MGSEGARRLAALLLAASVGLYANTAGAAPSAAQRETARRLMDEGKERAREGDMARAIEAYQKAHDLMHVPSTAIALVRAHLALNHLVEARDLALEILRMPREAKEPAVFEHARKQAKELEASLKQRIPTVKITIKGGPATRVTVDDGEIAPILLGEPVAMNPGKHAVVAKNADGVERRADVELAERDAKSVDLELPAAKPTVVVAPPITPPPKPPLAEEERRTERTTGGDVLVYGGFGLAAAGLAVGTVAGVITVTKSSDVKSQCENNLCDPAAKSDLDNAKSLATVSTIGFAAAGVGVACGVIGLLLPRTTRVTRTGSALHSEEGAPAVLLSPNGVALRGSF